ncbi:MAG TPA: ABC-F family ATP-binding cassette domain-containing protein [Acidobacteriota bacterium]|nr:ABC-F family ATP-binding cassette domain-containing protein [Acidobacteriota bacterium]HRR55798.1 ABC-F family ATP-binding cassette domain-containing protein [Acidobacteriota bacterium]HRV07261.1 ABC-F family ATP-binding cassette domain-containing protein [Acidobacteriota bacterium]
MLFRLEGIGKEFSGHWLFRAVNAQCNPGDRIGLVGRNGSGKTTLFRLIDRSLEPDEGTIVRRKDLEIVRVEQIPSYAPDRTLREEVLTVFEPLRRLERESAELEAAIAGGDLSPETSHRYEQVRLRLRLLGGYDYPARSEAVLFGLGFSADDLQKPVEHLSGGQRSRMALAKVLLRPGDLLLLDEPTNHLDIQGILWLEDYLCRLKTSVIIISHDRHFLDRVTAVTWELESARLFVYPAPYTRSRRFRAQRLRQEEEAWQAQQEWRRRTEDFIRRNIAGQNTRQAQARRKMLERTEWLAPPSEDSGAVPLVIPEAERGSELVVAVEEATVGFPGKPLLESVSLTIRRGERVALLGGNGTGKTTLLRTLLGELPVLRGMIRWGERFHPAYYAQEAVLDAPDRTVYDYLGRLHPAWTDTELRGFAARFGFRGEDIFKELGCLSGGERSRLQLARLFSRPCNVWFLDEPTNHLDIAAREALEESLATFSGALVTVSHDLAFVGRLANRFFWIHQGRLEEYSEAEALEERIRRSGTASDADSEPSAHRPLGFLERVGEATEVGAGNSATSTSEPRVRSDHSGLSKNEQKRLEWRLRELEAEIENREERRRRVLGRLHQKGGDHEELRLAAEEAARLEEELGGLYASWEELVAKLEPAEP